LTAAIAARFHWNARMKHSIVVALKVVVWAACLGPLAWLVYCAVTNTLGPDPTAAITFTTGLVTLPAADHLAGHYAAA